MIHRPIQHVGFVVDDIPSAVDHWVEHFGAGPFFWLGRHIAFDEVLLHGEPTTFDHSAAVGAWGSVYVEFAELHDVAPDLRSKLAPGSGSHANHVSIVADDPAAENARLDAAGMPAFLFLRQGPIEITFHEVPWTGTALEVHENSEMIQGMFGLFRSAHEGWDGTGERLREMG